MKLIVELDFDFDGLDEDFPDEVRKYLLATMESGAESTCSEIAINGVYPEKTCVVVLKEDFDSLVDDSNTLGALEAAGVDNWSGYSDAMQMLREGLEEY